MEKFRRNLVVIGCAGVALLACLGGQARAGDEVLEIDCRDGGRSQTEMNLCAMRAARDQDAKLQRLLAELKSTLTSAEAQDLKKVQAAWTIYLDAHCKWDASFFAGGSIQPMWRANCHAALVANRIDDLKHHLCEGHGMTGECDASHRYDWPDRELTPKEHTPPTK